MRDEIVADIERHYQLTEEPAPGPLGFDEDYGPFQAHPEGIRERFAREVMTSGHVERWGLGGNGYFVALATRVVEGRHPYVQLVYATPRGVEPSAGELIRNAWRLYGVEDQLRPVEVFAELLSRYGRDIRVGARNGHFVAVEILENPPEGQVMELAAPGGSGDHVNVFTAPLDAAHLAARWAFVVDETLYQHAARDHRA